MTTPPKSYGLAAIGKTSRFDIEVDGAIENSALQISISTQSWTFRFALPSRNEVARMLSFLREQNGHLTFSELTVGSFHGATVRLIKDNEFADRFWLRALGDYQFVEFVIVADDFIELTNALAQVVEQLQS